MTPSTPCRCITWQRACSTSRQEKDENRSKIGGSKFPLTTSRTRSPPIFLCFLKKERKKKNGLLKEQNISLYPPPPSAYWQRLQLQILTSASGPHATGHREQRRGFYPDDNARLHVGSALFKRKHSPPLWRWKLSSMPLVFHYNSCKTKPYAFLHPKQPHY